MKRMMGWARLGAVLRQSAFVAALFALTLPASAQERIPEDGSNGDGMDTHLFRPALDSKGFFTVNGSDILGANDISFGLVLDYGKNLMRTVDGDDPVPFGSAVPCANGLCPGSLFDPATGALVDTGRGDDALVGDSFQGTWSFNYGIANVAVVGITASNSPLSRNCDIVLGVAGSEDTNLYTPMSSRIAQLAVIDTLVTCLAQRQDAGFARHLDRVKHNLRPTRRPAANRKEKS